MKSEYDYSIKRKFVDIISKQKPQQLTSEALAAVGAENKTAIEDKVSTRKSSLSIRSGRRDNLVPKILVEGITTNVVPIIEEEGEKETTCTLCFNELTDDEVTINLRFIEQAISN